MLMRTLSRTAPRPNRTQTDAGLTSADINSHPNRCIAACMEKCRNKRAPSALCFSYPSFRCSAEQISGAHGAHEGIVAFVAQQSKALNLWETDAVFGCLDFGSQCCLFKPLLVLFGLILALFRKCLILIPSAEI